LPQEEIGLRLLGIPAFEEFEERLGEDVAAEIMEGVRVNSQAAISKPSR